ncbi:hypothetical protein M1403_00055 [Patescibacteria group bacterium]|nr:hypothetical protein [Patescibacteria group bacterium]
MSENPEKRPNLFRRTSRFSNRLLNRIAPFEILVGGAAIAETAGTVLDPNSPIISELSGSGWDVPGFLRRLNEAGAPPVVSIGFLVLMAAGGTYLFVDGTRRLFRRSANPPR